METGTQEPKAPPQHKEVENFSDSERTEWLKTGKMPALEETKEITPEKEGASAAPKPASGDGGKESGSGPGKKERDQERNFKELRERVEAAERDRDALRAENEEYKAGKRKPEEKKDAGPKLLEMPVRPKMKEFMGADGVLDSDKYETALDKYETDKTAYINQQTQIRTAAVQQEQAVNTWSTELKAKYGDKANGLDVKKTADALASTLKEAPAFFMFLNDSEVFTDLLFVLGTDPKLDELLAEAKDPKTMTRAIRKLVALEAGVKDELAKQGKKSANELNEGDEGKKRELTKAGKPPVEASGAVSSPADDGSSDAAWRRKDLSPEERGELYRERKNKEDREKRKKKVN